MEQVIFLVMRSPTARKWIFGAIAAAVVGVLFLGLMLLSAMSGQVSTEVEADAEKKKSQDCNVVAGTVQASTGPIHFPLKGQFSYTSEFGMRTQPMTGEYRLHAGADLALAQTGGPVLAAKDGKVAEVGHNEQGPGNNVLIDHGGGLETRYLHLADFNVEPGDSVKGGQQIGHEGNTTGPENISTGAHLHFEVHENGTPIDPVPWLKKAGLDMPAVGKSAAAPSSGKGGAAKSGSAAKPAAGPGGGSGGGAAPGASKVAGSGGAGFSMPKPSGPGMHTPGPNPPAPPAAHMKAFKSAEKKYGIPWQWLAGHSYEETHHYEIKAVSSAGAMGPMQFTPPTWQDFGVDGDGDGKADINNVTDAVHSSANMLSKTGGLDGPEGVKTAIKRYNQADWYVQDILWLANKYGNGQTVNVSSSGGGGAGAGPGCKGGEAQVQQVDATQCVTRVSKKMTPEQRAGQLIMAAAEPGTSLSKHENLGNMLFLGGWDSGVSGVRAEADEVQANAPTVDGVKVKMLVAADQEGGEVQQLTGSGFSTIPKATEQAGSSDLRSDAESWGQELSKAGVNVNLGPVADTVPADVGTKNEPIGKWGRQYGSTPGAAGKGASAFADGMRDADVTPTVKHFPGLGRITGNTDLTSSGITDKTATTKDTYLDPFDEAISGQETIVMVSSARYPKLDDGQTAAVFSQKIITGLLREKMGYEGVVATDDVGIAKAVGDVPVGDRATQHIAAGGDLVLTATPSQVPTMVDALVKEAEGDATFKKKMNASLARVLTLKEDKGLISCDDAKGGSSPSGDDGGPSPAAAPAGDVPSRRGGGDS